uniref:Uncharacterized protein n=1 Tax=Anguilla anguilla TaxID=7936 RepID=A0A0E9QW55_ANGAN
MELRPGLRAGRSSYSTQFLTKPFLYGLKCVLRGHNHA